MKRKGRNYLQPQAERKQKVKYGTHTCPSPVPGPKPVIVAEKKMPKSEILFGS
jgi:hypothetical protein